MDGCSGCNISPLRGEVMLDMKVERRSVVIDLLVMVCPGRSYM